MPYRSSSEHLKIAQDALKKVISPWLRKIAMFELTALAPSGSNGMERCSMVISPFIVAS
jgi:hypothetical protein